MANAVARQDYGEINPQLLVLQNEIDFRNTTELHKYSHRVNRAWKQAFQPNMSMATNIPQPS